MVREAEDMGKERGKRGEEGRTRLISFACSRVVKRGDVVVEAERKTNIIFQKRLVNYSTGLVWSALDCVRVRVRLRLRVGPMI